jgi:hypothetical protein
VNSLLWFSEGQSLQQQTLSEELKENICREIANFPEKHL